ncbi:MAG: carboxymuconolactone decarboxylase family protein, partial [bacterium]
AGRKPAGSRARMRVAIPSPLDTIGPSGVRMPAGSRHEPVYTRLTLASIHGERRSGGRAMDEAGRIERLRRRYGTTLIEAGLRQHGADFLDQIEWSDELDPHYTRLWLEFTYGGIYVRGVLDERTRQLIVVGQFVAMNELEELPVHIRAALAAGAQPREVLEVILQSTVYFGYSRARRASAVFRRSVVELGLLESVLAGAPKPEGRGLSRLLV